MIFYKQALRDARLWSKEAGVGLSFAELEEWTACSLFLVGANASEPPCLRGSVCLNRSMLTWLGEDVKYTSRILV